MFSLLALAGWIALLVRAPRFVSASTDELSRLTVSRRLSVYLVPLSYLAAYAAFQTRGPVAAAASALLVVSTGLLVALLRRSTRRAALRAAVLVVATVWLVPAAALLGSVAAPESELPGAPFLAVAVAPFCVAMTTWTALSPAPASWTERLLAFGAGLAALLFLLGGVYGAWLGVRSEPPRPAVVPPTVAASPARPVRDAGAPTVETPEEQNKSGVETELSCADVPLARFRASLVRSGLEAGEPQALDGSDTAQWLVATHVESGTWLVVNTPGGACLGVNDLLACEPIAQVSGLLPCLGVTMFGNETRHWYGWRDGRLARVRSFVGQRGETDREEDFDALAGAGHASPWPTVDAVVITAGLE